jgi:hypothetical protein
MFLTDATMKVRIILEYFFLLAGFSLFTPLCAQNLHIDIQSSFSWDAQQIDASVSLDLASAGIIFPNGRAQAEEIIDTEFPRLVQTSLFSLLIDSSNTLEDLINQNEFSLHDLSNTALSAQKIPPSLSLDMQSMISRFTIDLKSIRSLLVKHRTILRAPAIINPAPSRAYTGIIIFANTELPIHGRQSKTFPVPCIFPKIWDSEMNLLYERNMVRPNTARNQGIVKYVERNAVFQENPSGLSSELINLVGNNPLRIMAQGVFGKNPTDPIINREDALIIISNDDNKRLLQEGKVVIVLDNSTIRKDFVSE